MDLQGKILQECLLPNAAGKVWFQQPDSQLLNTSTAASPNVSRHFKATENQETPKKLEI